MSIPRSPFAAASPFEFSAEPFRGSRVVITGGLGFIGSNLAHVLHRVGAQLTLVDSMTDGDGANWENVRELVDAGVKAVVADIADAKPMEQALESADIVFNLSGKVSHIDSVKDPIGDMHANGVSQLHLLQLCRLKRPDLPIVYTSTRQIYGKADTARVTEESPIRPIDPNGISKFAADAYHRMFARDFGMKTAVLRITNTYGPRQLLRHNRQGFIPWFVRVALEGGEITIYGDGKQTRDVAYVDDVVEALLQVGALPNLSGEVFNVGSTFVHSVGEIASLAVELAAKGSMRLIPFPEEKKKIDIGSVACDFSALTAVTGWTPRVTLRSGLQQMIEYCQPRLAAYL